MLKKYLLAAIMICCWAAVRAQSDTLVFFLNDRDGYLQSREGAAVTRIVVKTGEPKALYTVHDYFLNTGKLKLAASSNADDGSVFHGACIEYFPNGKRRSISNYREGRMVGEFSTYYPNGQLRSTGKMNKNVYMMRIDEFRDSSGNIIAQHGQGAGVEYYPPPLGYADRGPIVDGVKEGEWLRFKDSKLQCKLFYHFDAVNSGMGYDSLGRGYPFKYIREGAEFKNKDKYITEFLRGNVKMTKEARRAKITGYIFVGFMVESDGAVTDVKIEQGLGYGLDEQAINAVKLTDHLWTPQREYGVPIASSHTIRIPVNREY